MKLINLLFLAILPTGILLVSCSDKKDPEKEVDTEVITEVRLIFSAFDGGAPVTFKAVDPDGAGQEGLVPEGPISLQPNTTYDLFIRLENTITNEDVTSEIEAEAVDHMFFFAFTSGLFHTPQGIGNVDERAPNAVIYGDTDPAGQPLGLITTWATGEPATGEFRIVLMHQPDGEKTATSTIEDGAVDVDVTWSLLLEP